MEGVQHNCGRDVERDHAVLLGPFSPNAQGREDLDHGCQAPFQRAPAEADDANGQVVRAGLDPVEHRMGIWAGSYGDDDVAYGQVWDEPRSVVDPVPVVAEIGSPETFGSHRRPAGGIDLKWEHDVRMSRVRTVADCRALRTAHRAIMPNAPGPTGRRGRR